MRFIEWLSPLRRSLLLGLIGLGLLAAPLWVPALHLDDPTYTYERTEIVVDDEEGITYVGGVGEQPRRLSDDIACTMPWDDYRTCALERQVLGNETIPSGVYTSNPNSTDPTITDGRYRYVQLDGSTYEPRAVVNRSVQNDAGSHELYLDLDPIPPEAVLDDVARDVSSERLDVPPAVREAARTGSATSHTVRDVPPTPIHVEGEGYYGVSIADQTDPTPMGQALGILLPIVCPFFGLFPLYRAATTVEIRYVGDAS